MTPEQVAVGLNDHENEIKSLKHRMKEVQEQQKALMKLTSSVETLAVNMEYMAKEQTKQGERLERLEHEPAETSKYYRRTIVSCILTSLVSGAVGYIISFILGG